MELVGGWMRAAGDEAQYLGHEHDRDSEASNEVPQGVLPGVLGQPSLDGKQGQVEVAVAEGLEGGQGRTRVLPLLHVRGDVGVERGLGLGAQPLHHRVRRRRRGRRGRRRTRRRPRARGPHQDGQGRRLVLHLATAAAARSVPWGGHGGGREEEEGPKAAAKMCGRRAAGWALAPRGLPA